MSRLLFVCPFSLFILLGALGLGVGCKSTQQESEEAAASDAAPVASTPRLAAPDASIRTVQLYAGSNERRLPVTTLERGGEPLTLEFDLLSTDGRPLSVYFQHADRNWERDLSPSRALESFQDDRLLDYRSSQGTEVPYVHYTYRFPNDEIRFRVSGNYILRVTERGRRDSVLFEYPFYVAEQKGGLKLEAEALAVPGQRAPSLRPVARFRPPPEIQGDPFGHTVCFVRNGRVTRPRCEERPKLMRQPELAFELSRNRAYAPIAAGYEVDLTTLQPSSQIAQVDRARSPVRVVLDADYARFGETPQGARGSSQPVVRSALPGRIDPAISAEYVETVFAFVPGQEQPYGAPLLVSGSFRGPTMADGVQMAWSRVRARYETDVLLKQGIYRYEYSTADPTLTAQLRATQPRITGRYTAFVYYRDARRNTDRLLQVRRFSP
jgi:hypothetical protein